MSDKNPDSANDPIRDTGKGSLAYRLSVLMRGRTVRQAAADWGIGTSTLNAYLRNGSVPNLNIANQIANVEGVTLQWLATGEGQIIPGDVNEMENQRIISMMTDDDELKEKLDVLANQKVRHKLQLYKELKDKIQLPDYSKEIVSTALSGSKVGPFDDEEIVQLISELNSPFSDEFALIAGYRVQVSAGNGSLNGDQSGPCRHLAFRKKWLKYRGFNENDLVIVWAKGDSMEPTINNNDTLVVNIARTRPQDGNIYVFRNGDELFVKRYQTVPGAWRLISNNPVYPPMDIVKHDQHQFDVVGQVVHIAKDIGN